LSDPPEVEELSFPDSLCHACAAPPRLIRTAKATYIFCPIFKRYPPQPVRECERFSPRDPSSGADER
jgi:hypothetical protein